MDNNLTEWAVAKRRTYGTGSVTELGDGRWLLRTSHRSTETGEQVAEKLVLSSETVKTHIRNAMAKLEASTRVHAIAIALREGYIQPPSSDGGAA